MGLSEQMQGDQPLDKLGNNLLGFLAGFVEAQVGAAYIAEAGQYRRFAAYAIPADESVDTVRPGDGLVGQAAKDKRALRVRDVPAGYLPISSGIGKGTPNELVVVPASIDGVVQAVWNWGFSAPPMPISANCCRASPNRLPSPCAPPRIVNVSKNCCRKPSSRRKSCRPARRNCASATRNSRNRGVRCGNRKPISRCSNPNSSRSTRSWRSRRNCSSIRRTNSPRRQVVLSARADELQRANEYKSEFLANMSHELRTPLNSTLILAKLLADNKDGNLTAAQVKFAKTITSAGNDLLALINDVLDLSRIEAGKVELAPEHVSVAGSVESLVKTFQPTADQKQSALLVDHRAGRARADRDGSAEARADSQEPAVECVQIHGERRGRVARVLAARTAPWPSRCATPASASRAHQQEVIFEAFRQADGSIHRKFGGTGLGLSISRDLAALLRRRDHCAKRTGRGQRVHLDVAGGLQVGAYAPSRDAAPAPEPDRREPAKRPRRKRRIAGMTEDDRNAITPGGRVILLVEDDPAFAMILRDLVREMGFQCVAAASANEGLVAAAQYLPSAILLDVNLPDHSGLGVLDSLKRDPRTRHIPVHMISVSDYKREAMELGAIGYALKPAKREELIEALRRLEAKFSQSVRRVLIVEDDPRQRESMRQLLSNGDVQITAVASAGEALAHLKDTTFDCMVVDLNLPDLSGYDLLEKMSQQEDVAFPPVIIYTGRALDREEEQRLRRYSKSIIIKDARSPERLVGRSHAVPAPGGGEIAARASADAENGTPPGERARGPPGADRGRRCAQRVCACRACSSPKASP